MDFPELQAPKLINRSDTAVARIFAKPLAQACGIEVPLEKSVPHPHFLGDRHHRLQDYCVQARIERHVISFLRALETVGHVLKREVNYRVPEANHTFAPQDPL